MGCSVVSAFHLARALDAIDGAHDLRLGGEARGATDAEPAAGVEDEQRAVAVLEDIGEMGVGRVKLEELVLTSAIGGAVGDQFHACDALGVEVRDEDLSLPSGIQRAGMQQTKAGDGDVAEVMDDGQIDGAGQAGDGLELIGARVDAAVEPVDEDVAARLAVEEIDRTDDVALGSEDDLHRVVGAAQGVPLDIGAIGIAGPDAGGEAVVHQRAILLDDMVAFAAVAPIEAAIGGIQKRAVDVGGVAGVVEAAHDHLALVGHAVAIGVGEFPDAGRRGDVERTLEPARALAERSCCQRRR